MHGIQQVLDGDIDDVIDALRASGRGDDDGCVKLTRHPA